MSRYSSEQRASILAQSRELLSYAVPDARQISEPELTHDEILQEALAQPVETSDERYRRLATERQERRAMQRERLRDNEQRFIRRAAAMDAATQAGWENWLRTRLDAERETERNRWREIIPEVIAAQRDDMLAEVAKLRADFELKVDELRTELSKQRAIADGSIADLLPPVPRRRNA